MELMNDLILYLFMSSKANIIFRKFIKMITLVTVIAFPLFQERGISIVRKNFVVLKFSSVDD